jgi:hypothetical protein
VSIPLISDVYLFMLFSEEQTINSVTLLSVPYLSGKAVDEGVFTMHI